MRRKRRIAARSGRLLVGLVFIMVAPASAEEGPMVFQAHGSSSDLAIRTGLALDMPGRPRFGVESHLHRPTRSGSGAVPPPLRLWGEMDIRRGNSAPASLGLVLDPATGASRAALRQSRAILDDGSARLSIGRSLEAGRRADGDAAFVASQDLQLAWVELQAILSGQIVMDNKAPLHAGIALEKRLPLDINVKAVLSGLAHQPAARISARFERQW